MATVVETVLATVKALQAAFLVIAGLGLTAYKYPVHTPVQNGTSYDFVIIGAGPGGSVMANRLTENPNVKVLLIEAGGDPPLESVLPGLFTLLPGSSLDYQYLSTNDNYTSQNLKEQRVPATAGKLLGGSSSISHTVHVRGNPHDYALWAKAAGDNGWNYDNMLPYLMKSEKLIDQDILKTPSARFHGRNGYLSIKKQPAAENEGIMAAFNQMGLPTAQNQLDPSFKLGIGEPFVNINAEGYRSLADEYLKPLGERPNFTIMKNSVAHQIYFRLDKTIEGVGVWITEGDEQRWAYIEVKREVIVSAGVFGTPKLLMLSGIGPREQLQSHHIPVISDLPVGKDLQDHIPAVIVSTLQAGEPVTTPANPHLFPVPITTGYHALDKSQSYPDYQTINLLFPADNTAQIQITSMVFGFNNNIAQQFFDGGAGRATLISIPNIMQSLSRGEVLLNSTDYKDDPIIRHGIYSNEADLHNMVLYLQDFSRIYNTTAFKSIGAKMIDLDLPACNNIKRGTYEYWRCYAIETSATLWAYTSTARMGTVLDSRLRVRGVHGVRVVDASAMPNTISGNIHAGVFGLAERAADLVKADWGASPRGMA